MTDVLASALRGDSSSLCRLREPGQLFSAVEVAERFGIGPLLRSVLQARGEWASVPGPLRTAFDAAAHREVALDSLRCRETRRVLAGLEDGSVSTLVLKGAALACTHYPAPYLRARADTDLLIKSKDRDVAARILGGLGYRQKNSVSRDAIERQAIFERTEGPVHHTLDVHWAISNTPLFAETLSFDELYDGAVTISHLGRSARTPGPVHALLIACVHRVAHHDDSPNPLWLYDIKLLAEGLTRADWDRVWCLAADKKIVAVCQRGLHLAEHIVGCSAVFEGVSGEQGDEASAAYIGGPGTAWRRLGLNVRGSAGVQAKVRYLAAYAFPAGSYMRSAYGASGPVSLAAAYLRRAWSGLRRLRGSKELR